MQEVLTGRRTFGLSKCAEDNNRAGMQKIDISMDLMEDCAEWSKLVQTAKVHPGMMIMTIMNLYARNQRRFIQTIQQPCRSEKTT